jgi:hypothetical protein
MMLSALSITGRTRWYLLVAAALAAVTGLALLLRPGLPPGNPGLLPTLDQAEGVDWPHLRSPNYDAISGETGLANAWPTEGPPVLWSRPLGQWYSGFVVAGGRAFTQTQTLGGQCVVCLDAETGAELWRHRYGWAWQPAGRYPGPYATPTYHAGKVYFSVPDGLVGWRPAGAFCSASCPLFPGRCKQHAARRVPPGVPGPGWCWRSPFTTGVQPSFLSGRSVNRAVYGLAGSF